MARHPRAPSGHPPERRPGDLPYANRKRRGRGVVLAGVAVLLLGAAALAAATADTGSGTPDDATAPAASRSTTEPPERSTTTAAPVTSTTTATTTTEPRTSTTTSATSNIPIAKLPRHEAVYRDGKLILQGTVPSKQVQERFRSEAAAVIGEDNVIVRYQIDSRVPVPTDGRVRVDEDFLFPKNSAAIDGRYEP
ncbi:hypothetical protein ACE2AJ_01330 [Aquihabitans daechungensis]|uniref:hypothetical protein n=1 Tax=Aquihabitans daechungensis TaxID=1052257 RepID=UPI003BA08F5A